MTLLHIFQQVLHAFGNALAMCLYGFLLCFSIESQKVTRRNRSSPLLDCKLDTCFGLGVCLRSIGKRHQSAGIEQIAGGCKSGHGIGSPSIC